MCHRARQKLWDDKNRGKKIAYNRSWSARHKARRAAMNLCSQIVFQAKRNGLLVAPERCGACQSTGRIEAAHTDYSKPLDVTWLCRPCHRAWDGNEPKTLAYAKPDLG